MDAGEAAGIRGRAFIIKYRLLENILTKRVWFYPRLKLISIEQCFQRGSASEGLYRPRSASLFNRICITEYTAQC